MPYRPLGFRDLAPETLATIRRDCAAQQVAHPPIEGLDGEALSKMGAQFWFDRQIGEGRGFPPLTPYIGDDSKVYLQEGGK